jgi:flagellar protein FlaG
MLDKMSNVTNQLPDMKIAPVVGVQNIKSSPKQQAQSETGLSKENVEKVVNSVNEFLKGTNTQLAYRYHEGLQHYYAVVVDDITNQVIKEIPSKKLLDIYAAMKDYTGLIIDEKA